MLSRMTAPLPRSFGNIGEPLPRNRQSQSHNTTAVCKPKKEACERGLCRDWTKAIATHQLTVWSRHLGVDSQGVNRCNKEGKDKDED